MRHINVETDELVPVGTIYKARTGKRLNPPTLWRWLRKGCHGIRLEAVPVNGTWCTTHHAFGQFLLEQTQARLADPAPEEPSPAPRDARTETKLRKAGLIT